ncbi:hypothetical protein AB0B04_19420 [Streptomyces xinghaiensis]|uniref:Uncharacterized protein n=2 Tax=Streptomyces TaxID=1883 RepID=A0A3R7EMP5_9ACTN|nr:MULTISPECIES: hypothetical protein [Streptomyces]KNE83352.1 hypothetical protein ADZ36_05900 [Streptomyces fradiae]OFA37025.1 hypothetical protein BEN35_29325 [Streptomyces fradiae]PQM20558.1 hypothetical protein Sfr7A_25510 [Streptomyces xinghaiensis]RKM92500.1 hypothetical protein SFRA_024165 [Streptomyces xinghaiensis]RNC70467.1 hypothetical protein DC095_025155 [Streptomyces xinghaiensis]
MPADGTGSRPAGPDGPENTVQRAIAWLHGDHSRTRQILTHRDRLISPGQLLDTARFDVQVDRLLANGITRVGQVQAQALIQAQAEWLIRHMPPDIPPALDSAQQAGRAWGILITADTETLPDQDVLTEVSRRTGISLRAADEIPVQARSASAAYTRADLLAPYDNARDEVLIGDWNMLAACGPEMPEALQRAQDVLQLLAARLASTGDYHWMDATAQHVAQIYDSVIRAQPLLAPVAAFIPGRDHADATAEQARMVEHDQQGLLAAAATAATRARAVQEWISRDTSSGPDRTRRMEAAAPGTRTLLRLSETLAALGPPHREPALTALDPQRIAQVVEAFGRLSADLRSTFHPTGTFTDAPAEHRSPQQQHQHPPTPDQGPEGGARPGR